MRYVPPVLHPYFVPVTQLCYSGSGENLRKTYFTQWIRSRTIFLAPNPEYVDFYASSVEYVHRGMHQHQQ